MSGTLVLLQGIPVTSTIWRHVAGPLARYGRVIAPDLLGLGPSPGPQAPRGPDDSFRWLDAEVPAGVEEPVTLVMHDVRGPVGLPWAVRRPEKLPWLGRSFRLYMLQHPLSLPSPLEATIIESTIRMSGLGGLLLHCMDVS